MGPGAVGSPPELGAPPSGGDSATPPRFLDLRGIRWRIDLGVLPRFPTTSIEDLRRVTADARRRYVNLRRQLLIDPHLPKDGSTSPDLSVDNPLSQNPDSTWGRYFKNAELEKMLDQDLSRLYPEDNGYFQTIGCQAMLRRILMMWCLRNQQCGYRQGMHELLAPLLYVLHVDVQRLHEVRQAYETYFINDFDEIPFPDIYPADNYKFAKAANWTATSGDGSKAKPCSLEELDPETRDIFMLSDAYGAEGELGAVISERFMEHDAYCMFEGLASGAGGVVAMAEFFLPSPTGVGLPPVIEASSALYHLLTIVDSSLHSHLVELGVEPQYFALRWLRLLFGREFPLEVLLAIWDEIFASPNGSVVEAGSDFAFNVLCSSRGAFISGMAVSMLLHLRSSLLATEYSTSCLQRLLNFPDNTDFKELIEKAKALQVLAMEANTPSLRLPEEPKSEKFTLQCGSSLLSSSVNCRAPIQPVLDSYWEEKWRVLHLDEEFRKASKDHPVSGAVMKGSLSQRFCLSRTESDPSPSKNMKISTQSTGAPPLVGRRFESDLSKAEDDNDIRIDLGTQSTDALPSARRQLESGFSKEEDDKDADFLGRKDPGCVEVFEGKHFSEVGTDQHEMERNSDCTEDACLSGENSSMLSMATSMLSIATSPWRTGNEHKNESGRSSVTSNSFIVDIDDDLHHVEGCCDVKDDDLLVQEAKENYNAEMALAIAGSEPNRTKMEESVVATPKERKAPSGKFQWFWKIGGKGSSEAAVGEKGSVETPQSSAVGKICRDDESESSASSDSFVSGVQNGRTEATDKKMLGTLKNLGQAMLENIQVIELVFQQERGGQAAALDNFSSNILGGRGQQTAMAALKELRKISNLLSEM